MDNQNQTNLDANKVISNLLNKLATAEYTQAVLEAQVSDLKKENDNLKSAKAEKEEGTK
ncbi:hypothetical protein ACM28P_01185 [Lactobacillus crispatus]|uniref:hypothetical protein n=1 Tax=Lactobacillus crispatus TaxID=47770 RepID=UPI0039F6934A